MRTGSKEMPPHISSVPNGADANMALASDIHWQLNNGVASEPRALVDALSKQRREVFFLLGDVYSAPAASRLSTAEAVIEVVELLSEKHDNVVFVPGNHDLRHLEDPWQRYKRLEKNRRVVMPHGKDPAVETVAGVRVMAANVFYDGSLFHEQDIARLGQNARDLLQFYNENMEDGSSLFPGRQEDFSVYRRAADRTLVHNADVEILATHAPAHAAAVAIPVPEYTSPETVGYFAQKGVRLLLNDDENRAMAESMVWFRNSGRNMHQFYRNVALASFWAGSNMLGTCNTTLREVSTEARYQLLSLFGHTHQLVDHIANVGRKDVRFFATPTRHYSTPKLSS